MLNVIALANIGPHGQHVCGWVPSRISSTHTGMTTDDFSAAVREWIRKTADYVLLNFRVPVEQRSGDRCTRCVVELYHSMWRGAEGRNV